MASIHEIKNANKSRDTAPLNSHIGPQVHLPSADD